MNPAEGMNEKSSHNNTDQLDEIVDEDRPLVAETEKILSRSRYTISI